MMTALHVSAPSPQVRALIAVKLIPLRDTSHVRELAGAMEEKKAGWGILITTSRFTPICEQKAREHSRMELIDGNRLVWLIKEHLGKKVLIGPPSVK